MKIETTITTIVLSLVVGMSSGLLDPCPGDTRGDRYIYVLEYLKMLFLDFFLDA